MKKFLLFLPYMLLLSVIISCDRNSEPDIDLTSRDELLIAYDLVLQNWNLEKVVEDSLYQVVLDSFEVTRTDLDSLRSAFIRTSPTDPQLIERISAQLDSLQKANIFSLTSEK